MSLTLSAKAQQRMKQLVLYSTSHCHLCEQAETLLKNVQHQYAIQWQIIEISDSDELIAEYGIKIPVIRYVKNQTELFWPFTQADIVKLIAN